MLKHFENARKIALEMMQPSKKDLEHGLELHYNSFVFDAYGFTPLGGGYAEQVEKLVSENAGRDEVKFAIEEFMMNSSFKNPEMRKALREAWDFSGVDCNFQNSGLEGNDIENLIKRLSFYTYMTDSMPEIYERAIFPDQLEGIRERGHKALFMTTNGVPLSAKYVSTDEALNQISVFFKLGVRMMHLTYNRRNLIGDGCAEKSNAGLSDFGRQVVAAMNRAGVIPDVAHSGQRTSLEAALCSEKPVVASHSAAGKLSTHYRAKCDEVIEAIKKTNGFIGICGHPWFLQGKMNINAMIDHIDYVAKTYGVDHVAIGTDNTPMLAALELKNIAYPQYRPIWEQYWQHPDDVNGTMTSEQYVSSSWVNWPLFTVGLVQRGYSDKDIRKIIGGNVLRVCRETLQ
ncbi:MAG: membrane dipeptidase [Lentisphaeria bacterium]|nr:membrane dipeptidase [Lentisphaeria bacterium]